MSIDKWSAPVTLEGQKIRLIPASLEHVDAIISNVLFPESWHAEHWPLATEADVRSMLQKRAILGREDATNNCFVMIEKSSGKVVGVSNLMNFNRRHNHIEIGGTCVGKAWQKTFVNTEAKLLMLGYAFEEIGCQRVEFNVDALNFNSQRAVLRIGAKFEGELRQSWLQPDGRRRDRRIYAIIDSEWPNIKRCLQWYLE